MMPKRVIRCAWCGHDPLYQKYHDSEWGVPLHDDQRLFEMLVLEGAQAGLSWITILKKRDNYRAAFDHFDIDTVASYDETKHASLLADSGIVRNRLKIKAATTNARAVQQIQHAYGSLDTFLWSFVDGTPIQNHWQHLEQIPAETALSRTLSKEFKNYGCNFIGPTICYSLMQSIGMVNDHTTDCFRYAELRG